MSDNSYFETLPEEVRQIMSRIFRPNQEPEEMLKYVWRSYHFGEEFQPNFNGKDSTKACLLRKMGNNSYVEGNCLAALNSYNKSICLAEPNSEDLSFGFGNRSAALFRLGQYEECIKDIKISFDIGYPEEKQGKLIERGEMCLKYLNNKVESVAKSSLDDLLKRASKDNAAPCCSLDYDKGFKNKANLYPFLAKKFVIPEMALRNPQIPPLSDACEMKFDQQGGISIFAKRDIFPGEIVFHEADLPFCGPEVNGRSELFCSYCGVLTLTPVPCSSCASVVFCSDSCRNSANKSFHNTECLLYFPILSQEMGQKTIAVLRSLFRVPFPKVKSLFAEYLGEKRTLPLDKCIFNKPEEPPYLKTYFHLINYEYLSTEDLFRHSLLAITIMNLISAHTDYLGEKCAIQPNEELSGDYLEFARIFFHLYAFQDLCLDTQRLPYYLGHSRPVRPEMYNYMAIQSYLFRHACDSNSHAFPYGSTLLTRSCKYIPKGDEITLNYAVYINYQDFQLRRKSPKSHKIKCQCYNCERNWVIKSLINSVLICPTCKNAINTIYGCKNCKTNTFVIPERMRVGKTAPSLSAEQLHSMLTESSNRLLKKSFLDRSREIQELKSLVALYCYFTAGQSLQQCSLEVALLYHYYHQSFHWH